MGECLLIGKGFRGLAPETGPSMLTTEIITSNTEWIPTSDMVGNQVSVTLFGGGGGGFEGVTSDEQMGGGGGCMNKSTINIKKGQSINIVIGPGGVGGYFDGKNATHGGTSYFGNYLSASGGNGASRYRGGNGGSEGGIIYTKSNSGNNVSYAYGGTGYQFGGGGVAIYKGSYVDRAVGEMAVFWEADMGQEQMEDQAKEVEEDFILQV